MPTVQRAVPSSPQERVRDAREKEREPGVRVIFFGDGGEDGARRWRGGGRGDVVVLEVGGAAGAGAKVV